MLTKRFKTGLYLSSILLFCLACPLQSLATSPTGNVSHEKHPPPVKAKKHNRKKNYGTTLNSFKNVENFPRLLSTGKLDMQDIPSPHWKKNGCIACHKSPGRKAQANNLRHTNVKEICNNCHSAEFDHRYIHPSNVKPDKNMLMRMDKGMKNLLRKNHNKMSCNTCHDLSIQCLQKSEKHKLSNPGFFRSGTQFNRSQLCFLCHDKKQFQRLNPHDQIDNKGKLKEEKCRICHADSLNKLRRAKNINELEFNAKGSLASMCWGCHPWIPHPGGQFTFFKQKSGPGHLVKPSEWVAENLHKMSEKNQINFPLEPGTGKVFCGTCHNPHEKGVIKNPASAKGADSKRRLRDQNICQYCHLK